MTAGGRVSALQTWVRNVAINLLVSTISMWKPLWLKASYPRARFMDNHQGHSREGGKGIGGFFGGAFDVGLGTASTCARERDPYPICCRDFPTSSPGQKSVTSARNKRATTMFESILFSNFLHDRMAERHMTVDELAHGLTFRTNIHVQSWVDGRSRPAVWQLQRLTTILNADPVDVTVGWVIDQCPELEEVLRTEVLDPRKSCFPRSTDLALRAPKPRKWDTCDDL